MYYPMKIKYLTFTMHVHKTSNLPLTWHPALSNILAYLTVFSTSSNIRILQVIGIFNSLWQMLTEKATIKPEYYLQLSTERKIWREESHFLSLCALVP